MRDLLAPLSKLISGKTRVSGLIGSANSAILAALLSKPKTVGPIFVITSTSSKARALKAEIELFAQKQVLFFPALDILPGEEVRPSPELVGERLAALHRLSIGENIAVIAPVKAIMGKTISKLEIRDSKLEIKLAAKFALSVLIERLIQLGYKRFDIVGGRGEFSVRGGIVDLFPLDLDRPVRLDFQDDKIENICYFDPYSQRSLEKIASLTVLPARERAEAAVFEHLPKNALVVFDELLEIEQVMGIENVGAARNQRTGTSPVPTLSLSSFLAPGDEALFTAPDSYVGKFADIPQSAIIITRHALRLQGEIPGRVMPGSLRAGFQFADFLVLSDRELFGEEVVFRKIKPIAPEGVANELLADLKAGDYVVHENYGIALYQGTTTLEIDGLNQEYLLLEFADGDKVYVPPSLAGLVEKYSSAGDFKPKLSQLGSRHWAKTKSKVKAVLRDMTSELLTLYAARAKAEGISFLPDDIWQQELAATFPFDETPDQKRAILETKADMEAPRPMDRLICGDVGYGKTEVAIRAAAKAVSSGKQVAILVPTTILADQHYNNFKERFKSSPFNIEMLSRFRSKAEQAEIVKALSQGGLDMVIGTHRLLSNDVKFKDLGLLIIDEEQRFGVRHKEKLKKLKKNIDVLTLSATPIPRTLYLSLSGARDMSVINTPPVDRSPIKTYVLPWSETVLSEAISRELDRAGQIYFLHNTIETIDAMAAKVKRLAPAARVAIAHGQMAEQALEQVMLDFMARKFDCLICTSIIESGLDITNVNTILIDSADHFGLSQLYQIRGRVGRASVRAYAYLFYHPDQVLTAGALERLKAIQEFTALGSGYKLAMRDLEIRGAGNLLGAQQSGHIVEVGFDLYCELLEEAVREAKGIKEELPRSVEIDLKVEAYIPADYVSDERQRIAIYRRMNLLTSKQELTQLKQELRQRFGQLPAKLKVMLRLLNLKLEATAAGIHSLKEKEGWLLIEKVSGKVKRVAIKGEDKINFARQCIAG